MSSIKKYYSYYDEWDRLARHRIEFEITKRTLDKYIPKEGTVLDIGGGPGRYSIYLSKKGHEVSLVDLCDNLVEQAQKNSKEADTELKAYIKGNVLDLSKLLPKKEYDAVLCMGPMYHLLEENQRREAINQCMNFLKKDGFLFVSFISVYAPIVECLKSYPLDIERKKELYIKFFEDGRHFSNDNEGFTDAYFFNPACIKDYMSQFNLKSINLLAVEGLGAMVEDKLMQLPEKTFKTWLDILESIASNPEVWGSCQHLLYIGRKK